MKEYIVTIIWKDKIETSSTIACDNYSMKENALYLYGPKAPDAPNLFTVVPFASMKYFSISYREV